MLTICGADGVVNTARGDPWKASCQMILRRKDKDLAHKEAVPIDYREDQDTCMAQKVWEMHFMDQHTIEKI